MNIFGKSSNCCIVCQKSPVKVPFLRMHRFPKNEVKRNIWLSACGLEADEYLPTRKLCSRHFDETCYTKPSFRLKSDAIPTKYLKGQIIRAYFQLSEYKTINLTLKNDELLISHQPFLTFRPSTSVTSNVSSKINKSTQTVSSLPSTPELQKTPKKKNVLSVK